MTSLVTFARWLYSLRHRWRADLERYQRRQLWASRGVTLDATVILRLDEGSRLSIDRETVIGPFTILDLLGDPASPAASSSTLTIGRRVAINEFNNIRASGGEVVIGDGTLIAQYVSIIATNHSLAMGTWMRDQPWDMAKRTVFIGEDVWIGAGAVILPGVNIGNGAVIGANAVVTRDVPDLAIAAGVPARVVGSRRDGRAGT